MNDFKHLIGKRIRYKHTGNIFIPKKLVQRGTDNYYTVRTVTPTFDSDGEVIYCFNEEFDEHFEILSITNWRKELTP